ncbi:MAG TPA: T9SS type A sorting domain-containing protein [Flavobacterium sp.]|nr:T9SS type A sorting domain-containing protein [Flavobacterium sp.]
MRFYFYIVLVFFCGIKSFAQSNQSWGGYFSYNNVIGLTESDSKVIAGTENAMFSIDLSTNEIETKNSIDGLKSEQITSIYHSKAYNITLIGNINGLLIIVNHTTNQIANKVDIISNIPVTHTLKKINHFTEYEGKVFIATDYGISVFNLQTLEFGDTFFISETGTETKVIQTTIFNGEIYALTKDPFTIRTASLSNPNIINFNAWDTFSTTNWSGIASNENNLVTTIANAVHRHNGAGGTSVVLTTDQNIIDLKAVNGYLIVTTPSSVYVLDQNLTMIAHINQIFEEPMNFITATYLNNTVYIATQTKGVFAVNSNATSAYLNFIPAGPQRNKIYALGASSNALWCVFGDNSFDYNPFFPSLGRYGISKYTAEGWLDIPYTDVLGATNLATVAVKPNNENEVYIGSTNSGVLKVVDNVPTLLYNQTNTGQNGLQSLVLPQDPSYISVRVTGLSYDKSGNLWATNDLVNKSLKKMTTSGDWSSYDIGVKGQYGDLVVDQNGTKWVATLSQGLIGFNEQYQNRTIAINTSYEGGLPYNHVFSLAVDKSKRLWIGTTWGLRILPSVDRFLTETQPRVNPVIIIDDGLPQELLYRQTVKKIKINGADQKWLGTLGAGAFLVSSNGQETIHHFTKENSPLPSNNILDIEINEITGEVFFATDKGMVSFKGSATAPSGSLKDVYVYPNPVRPEYIGTVKIAGLTDEANVKITDIEGNLVYEFKSQGGTIEWDTTAFGKYRVASGVYMVFISTKDGSDTTIKKIMLIR